MKPLDQYRFARVLCIVSHADDETIFAGGTLHKLAQQDCRLGIAVCTRIQDTNPAPAGVDDSARQERRLVAFGSVCGMLGVEDRWLFNADNSRQGMSEPTMASDIEIKIGGGVLLAVKDFAPDVVITHGADGEYGHLQHKVCHNVVCRLWHGPLWTFSATGPLIVPIDLEWKKRLARCYRHGTTQDVGWAPYCRNVDSPLEPWLGSEERFAHA